MIIPNEITIGIVGAGTMGQGIAQACASAGCRVKLFDINPESVSMGLEKISQSFQALVQKEKISDADKQKFTSNIKGVDQLSELTGDFIIEAAVEDLTVKQKIFSELEAIVSEGTILLSNTSSIQITQIAQCLKRPERFAGLHFFNPASVMRLVEIIQGTYTSKTTVEKVSELAAAIKKHPVIAQDSPGFIVNRVARLYYVEALKILEEGNADEKTIDMLMRNAGFKMGPFELMDLIGIDVNLSVTKSIFHAFHGESRFRPSRIQQQKVDAGMLGRKSGRGFYDYK
jgi:3-hydroxybutyryl-CoA dehydrogenase